MNRVVITGTGAVSPFGVGVNKLHLGFEEGRSSVRNMKLEWEESLPELGCWVGAPLTEQINEKSIPRKYRRSMGRTAILSSLASMEAVEQARLTPDLLSSPRAGVSFASTTGSTQSMTDFFTSFLIQKNVTQLSSGTFFKVMSHTCASNLAHMYNIKGRVISPDCACASSTLAIGMGYEAIKYGLQDIMLCGGSDELSVITSATFESVTAISNHYNDQPTSTPRPFDRDRDGTVCGEGAGCLVLESLDSARKRGVPIIAEVVGFATCSDGTHLAQAYSESLIRCIQNAMTDAHVLPEEIDYINAHATGTEVGDTAEAEAIRTIFPKGDVKVSSLKGHIGHTLGASGALESIAVLKGLESGTLYPSRNLDHIDDSCDGIFLFRRNTKQEAKTFLKNSFAFGGINTVLVYRRDELC